MYVLDIAVSAGPLDLVEGQGVVEVDPGLGTWQFEAQRQAHEMRLEIGFVRQSTRD